MKTSASTKTPIKNSLNLLGQARESAGFTKYEACNGLHIDHRRLRQLETDTMPDLIRLVSEAAELYQDPTLLDRYLGQFTGRNVEAKELPIAVLGVVAALGNLQSAQTRLIEIARDGVIDQTERVDFEEIVQVLGDLIEQAESLRMLAMHGERMRAA